jgi:hypothetical protein
MPLWILKRWLKKIKTTPQRGKSGGGEEKRAPQLDNSALTAPRSADVCMTEMEEEEVYAKEEDGGIKTGKTEVTEAMEEDVCIKEEVLAELRALCRYTVYLLYWHKSTNTDAEAGTKVQILTQKLGFAGAATRYRPYTFVPTR